MATLVTLGGNGTLFVGEDKILSLEVLDVNLAPVDMSGWNVILDIRLRDTSVDPPLLVKIATISGVYNVSRPVNTQRAVVTLSDDETNLFKGVPPQAAYRHSWKRTDEDSETVLAWGDFTPQKATAP